jgi:hypothetical protein
MSESKGLALTRVKFVRLIEIEREEVVGNLHSEAYKLIEQSAKTADYRLPKV